MRRSIELLLDRRVWLYGDHWWPPSTLADGSENVDNRLFECRENIMYLGHLLLLCVMYEALTGDRRYSELSDGRREASYGVAIVGTNYSECKV